MTSFKKILFPALVVLLQLPLLNAQTTSRTEPSKAASSSTTTIHTKTANGTSQDIEKKSISPATRTTDQRQAVPATNSQRQQGTLRGSDKKQAEPTRDQLSKAGGNKAKPAPEKKPADGRTKTGDKIDHRTKGPKGETVYMGERGGRYYLDKKGNRVYMKRPTPKPGPAQKPAPVAPAKTKAQ